jgi:glycosyltransferase involved in cell wall biosynthesis
MYTHAFAPHVGGVENVAMSLATGLAKLNLAGNSGTPNITVVTRTPRGDFDDASLPFGIVRQPSISLLMRLIRASDVIHLAGPCLLPMLIGLLFRKPVVVEHHGFQTICPNGQLLNEAAQIPCPGHFMAGRHGECVRCNAKGGLVRSLTLWFRTFPRRWLCTRVSANIMPTNWLSSLVRLPRSATVYHGLASTKMPEVLSAPVQPPTFAFLGRLVSTKGVHTLLQAAATLRAEGFQFRLKVIGDGPDRVILQNQALESGLGDAAEFLGYVAPGDLEKQLADVSTVVMPSLAGEVFGLVAAENMARGKLLIASDTGALTEVIGDAGLIFAAGDVEGLTRCMKRVLQDATLARQLGSAARTRASREFTRKRMLGQHLDLYSGVVKCPK